MKTNKWITYLERSFKKVLYANYLLQGEIEIWQDSKRHLLVMELEALSTIVT